jgi:glycosyltransferase involved in cell wall biosynthesis
VATGPRIAIDVRPLTLGHVTGVGLVVAQILEELSGLGCSFVAVADLPVPRGMIPDSVPVALGPPAGGRIRWEAAVLPRVLAALDPAPDLYHATWNHGVPRGLPFPAVLTIHDLIPWRAPEAVPWPRPAPLHRFLYRRAVVGSARAAAAIVTVSEASRRDIEASIPGAAGRVHVVPNALPRWFRPADEAQGRAFRARFGGGSYWLYVGGFDPRKGIDTLLDAVARLQAGGAAAPPLVLAGAPNEESRRHEREAERRGVRAHFPGYVPDADLPALFAGASLFIYPSRHEGFGIPLLFAMASGLPCVVSDGGSLPEVAGEAGVVFPAGDAAALAGILARARADPGSLAERAARGPARAGLFTPEALARGTIRVYELAARSRAGSA